MKKDISVKGATYQRLRREAKKQGVTVTTLVADIVHRFFHGEPLPPKRRSTPPVIPSTF